MTALSSFFADLRALAAVSRGPVCTLCLALVGCSGLTAVVHVDSPARIPLETFPRVYIASLPTSDPGTDALGARLGQALQARSTQVETIPVAELESQRLAGRVVSPSIVVTLQLLLRSSLVPRQITDPQTICGPSGCITRQRNRMVNVPTLQGRLVVRVYDGPSARPLQQVELESQRQEGGVDVLLRDRVMNDLSARLLEAVQTRRLSKRISLVRVDLAGVEPALEQMAGGRWREARDALEALRVQANALPADARAAFYYDLGIARRFDPRTLDRDPEAHFEAAEQALRQAVQLDPEARYALALRDMQEHRAQVRLVLQQREAAAHNFGLEPRQVVPEQPPSPPPGYERTTPPTTP